jgi:RNA polymerase sigma-70 factor (ECF subfamily)
VKELTKSIRGVRMQFLDAVEPFRGDLHRYCRSLTGSLWDAEDLSQETLLRAFAKLPEVHWEVANPKSYLFTIATNAWIDRKRKSKEGALPEDWDVEAPEEPGRLAPEVRDAFVGLVHALPPQERAAILLKDVFELSLDEIGISLQTTKGAVKAALHRGRARLQELQDRGGVAAPSEGPKARVSDELLNAFIHAFNSRDLDGLTSLLLDDSRARVIGMVHEEGRDQIRNGSLHHTLFDEAGSPHAERVTWRGEKLLVLWYVDKAGVRAIQDVLRIEERNGRILSLDYYYFCPEVLRTVAAELGLPIRDNGYRYGKV